MNNCQHLAHVLSPAAHRLWACGLLLLAACGGGNREENPPEYEASLAAKLSYEALYLDGKVETFLNGRLHSGEMPEDFRQQLIDSYNSHLRQVEREHHGVRTTEVIRAEKDTSLDCMQVFLAITYVDGVREEIVVPMVTDDDGRWHMK